MIGKLLYKIIIKTGWYFVLFGRKVSAFGSKITAFGCDIKDKGYDWFPEARKETLTDEDQIKENIISAQVKKGGCEVQSGCFRRLDCVDDEEHKRQKERERMLSSIAGSNEFLDILKESGRLE